MPLVGQVLLARWRRMRRAATRLRQDTSGATAIEYGLIAVGLSIFILVAVFAVGDELNNFFFAVQTQLAAGGPT